MKKLILLIVLGAAGYFAYMRFQAANPEQVENPVYAEIRMDANLGGRELNLVLFGVMTSPEDCNQRTDRAWKE